MAMTRKKEEYAVVRGNSIFIYKLHIGAQEPRFGCIIIQQNDDILIAKVELVH